jgi:hypothetical protein
MSDYHDSQYMYEAQNQLEQMAQNHFASLIDDKGFSFGPMERTAYNFTKTGAGSPAPSGRGGRRHCRAAARPFIILPCLHIC